MAAWSEVDRTMCDGIGRGGCEEEDGSGEDVDECGGRREVSVIGRCLGVADRRREVRSDESW